MMSQIITVHNIQEAIEDVGIVPYANTMVQELAGGYFFVDAEITTEKEFKRIKHFEPFRSSILKAGWFVSKHEDSDAYSEADDPPPQVYYWKWRVVEVPQKIAYFIIQALRLKSQAMSLEVGSTDEHQETMAVYLTPGTEIFGHKVEKLTEIPAELKPTAHNRLKYTIFNRKTGKVENDSLIVTQDGVIAGWDETEGWNSDCINQDDYAVHLKEKPLTEIKAELRPVVVERL